MALTYDFDMFSIMPKEIQERFGDTFKELGMSEQMKEQRALFRDPAAVMALQGASDAVKKCVIDSGFGINVYDSGAGPGCFPPSDAQARMNVLGKLRQNLRQLPPEADWNGFDIDAFMESAATARPNDVPAHSLKEIRRNSVPNVSPAREGSAVDLDSFFTAKPTDARAYASGPVSGPDMDSFFSNSPAARGGQGVGAAELIESVRATYDVPPRRKNKSLVMMAVMGLGLYLVVSFVAGDGALAKLLPAPQIVSIDGG